MKLPVVYLEKIQIKTGLSADAPEENVIALMVLDGLMWGRGWFYLMSSERLLLSKKYKAFLQCNAPVEFLEGT